MRALSWRRSKIDVKINKYQRKIAKFDLKIYNLQLHQPMAQGFVLAKWR